MAKQKKSQHSPVVLDGLCRNIRCKGMYVGVRQQMGDHNMMPMDTTHWWCNHTSKAVGPDYMPCNKEDCGKERGCYESEDETAPVA